MGNYFQTNKSSFHWEYTEEPHYSRRIEILKKYPQIKKLMKSDGDRRLVILGLTFLTSQLCLAYFSHRCIHNGFWRVALSCFFGNWIASFLLFHSHEAAHGTVFGPNSVWKNRLYGFILNIGIGTPFFSFFKKHHKNHHKYIGDEILDAEYPSEIEAAVFPNNALGKYSWLVLQPVIYVVRTPLLIVQDPNWWWDGEELSNGILICFYAFLCFYCGCPYIWGHCAMSSMAAGGSNIFGYWGIMSHIEFFRMRETFSYYGYLNKVFMNFGYHVEHHDFPNVPSRYLEQIRRLAPEYYEDLLSLDSFHSATIKYLFDPKVGVFSRLKRSNNSSKISYFDSKIKRY